MYDNLQKLAQKLQPSEFLTRYNKSMPVPYSVIKAPYRPDMQQVYSAQATKYMPEFLNKALHSGNPNSVRVRVINAIAKQRRAPASFQYKSPVAKQILDTRFTPEQHSSLLSFNDVINIYKPLASTEGLLGRLGNAGSDIHPITNKPIAYVPDTPGDAVTAGLGYHAVANHELTHAHHQQRIPKKPVLHPAWKIFDNKYDDVVKTPYLKDFVRGSPDLDYPTGTKEERKAYRDAYDQYIKAYHAWKALEGARLDAQYGIKINDQQDEQYTMDKSFREVAPVTGDLLFMGERFAREHGWKPGQQKQLSPEQQQLFNDQLRQAAQSGDYAELQKLTNRPSDPRLLQHIVEFPGGKRHDINWMRDQAHQHGYWNGGNLHKLIFDTPEGRQWYLDMLRRYVLNDAN